MPSLSLKLFGEFQARLDDQLIPGFRTNKVQALLVYLVIEQERSSREKLMELLWPGMPERSARHNLRQILYNLRGAIPDLDTTKEGGKSAVSLLLTNRHMIKLNPDAAITADVAQFESLLGKVQSHDHPDLLGCKVCKGDLESAVSLYQGEFLADFYLVDSSDFEDWAQMVRQAYRRKALDGLEILTTIATREQDFPAARELAERQLEIDNLRESSYRQQMEVLALSGRREEALAVYESCRRLLAEELSMQPAKRTTEIYDQILAGELSFDKPRTYGVRGYELKEEIGAGAHGAIHRAVQAAIGREVAVKVINRKYTNDPEFIRRFEDEAQIIARLEHPYVVPLYDYWRDTNGTYLVMRYLKGGNLLSRLANGPWNPEPAVKMLDQVTSALAAAHGLGIVHRDIKPANILFDESGNAYLSDFSIAKELNRNGSLTSSGGVLGTPDYISPEQILDEKVGPQSDLYSLGAVIYETLTGEKPFGDSSVPNLIYKHINEPFPLISDSRPDLSSEIDDVIQKATAKHPTDRYLDALEMAEAVRRALIGGEKTLSIQTIIESGLEPYNPYKGLRPFQEMDADDFFGRDALVDRLISRLSVANPAHGANLEGENGRFLTVVGPSGSGKSSAVKAGLIPALRAGAIPGSEKWFVVEMVPGTHPLEELEMALWPVAVDAPPSLVEPMKRDVRGMLRTLRRILPEENLPNSTPNLLLIIDQFEELFTLVEDEERRTFFLDSILAAISAPRSPLRVIITLRADFYDRPLQYQRLGQLIKHNTEVVLPLTSEELTWVIREPARRVGVSLEEGLSEAIIADVVDQPGTLPLLQYALTELYERKQGNQMTLEAYQQIGGVHGALGRRAESLFADLGSAEQETTRQLFLRLVTLGEGVEDTRRRVLRTELEAVTHQPQPPANEKPFSGEDDSQTGITISAGKIIDLFGQARLLTFDRDPMTRSSTVEVAHEALIREWQRLRSWLADSRSDIRLQRLLARAAAEWLEAKKDESYLLQGARLTQFESWETGSSIAITDDERQFLEKSISSRESRETAEETRRQRELETLSKLAETERARAETESRRAEEQLGAAKRLRRLAVLLAVVLSVAVVLAFMALQFGRVAGQNAERAEEFAHLSQSRELAAASNSTLNVDPELSLLLALEGMDFSRTTEAENALHQALLASRVRRRFVGQGTIVERVAYSPDGSLIATAEREKRQASIWNARDGRLLHEVPIGQPEACCLGLYFDEDSQKLAAVETAAEFSLGIWNVSTGEKFESISFPVSPGSVNFYALGPDWMQLALARVGGAAEIWDVESSEMLFELPGHDGNVELEYSQDGSRLVSYDQLGGLIIVWDPQTGELLHRFESGLSINDHVVSSDGRFAAFVDESGEEIHIFDFENITAGGQPEFIVIPAGHQSITFMLAFSPDSRYVASASRDGEAKVFDVESGQELLSLPHGSSVRSLTFHPDSSQLLTGDFEGVSRIWDISSEGSAERLALSVPAEIRSAEFSPDGKLLVTGSWDNAARIWNAETGDLLHTLEEHEGVVMDIAFRPDGQQLATASTDGTVHIWDVQTGRSLQTLSRHNRGDVGGFFTGVLGLNYSPDGTQLITAGADGTLRFWDPVSGDQIDLIASSLGLTNILFSPDGQYLAFASDGPNARATILDAETREQLLVIPIGPQIWSLAFSPDGRFLATAGGDTSVRLWALDYDLKQADLLTATLESHATSVLTVDFSPDGRFLASATRSEVRLWDTSGLDPEKGGGRVPELLMLPGGLGSKFSPDGQELVSGGIEGLLRFYQLEPEALINLANDRLTRTWTEQECQKYLHLDTCSAD